MNLNRICLSFCCTFFHRIFLIEPQKSNVTYLLLFFTWADIAISRSLIGTWLWLLLQTTKSWPWNHLEKVFVKVLILLYRNVKSRKPWSQMLLHIKLPCFETTFSNFFFILSVFHSGYISWFQRLTGSVP